MFKMEITGRKPKTYIFGSQEPEKAVEPEPVPAPKKRTRKKKEEVSNNDVSE